MLTGWIVLAEELRRVQDRSKFAPSATYALEFLSCRVIPVRINFVDYLLKVSSQICYIHSFSIGEILSISGHIITLYAYMLLQHTAQFTIVDQLLLEKFDPLK